MEGIQHKLLDKMREEGLTQLRGSRATVSQSETVVPTVTDWDAFYEYIKENDAMFMLERRAAAAPYRELLQTGAQIPGVEPFTKINLNMRKL